MKVLDFSYLSTQVAQIENETAHLLQSVPSKEAEQMRPQYNMSITIIKNKLRSLLHTFGQTERKKSDGINVKDGGNTLKFLFATKDKDNQDRASINKTLIDIILNQNSTQSAEVDTVYVLKNFTLISQHLKLLHDNRMRDFEELKFDSNMSLIAPRTSIYMNQMYIAHKQLNNVMTLLTNKIGQLIMALNYLKINGFITDMLLEWDDVKDALTYDRLNYHVDEHNFRDLFMKCKHAAALSTTSNMIYIVITVPLMHKTPYNLYQTIPITQMVGNEMLTLEPGSFSNFFAIDKQFKTYSKFTTDRDCFIIFDTRICLVKTELVVAKSTDCMIIVVFILR